MSKLIKQESSFTTADDGKTLNWWSLVRQALSRRVTIAVLGCLLLWMPLVVVGLNPVWLAILSDGWRAFLFAAPLSLFLVMIWFIWQDFVQPWLYLRIWLLEMHGGNLSIRMPKFENSSLHILCDDLNSLAAMLESQSHHTERQLREHTQHIAEKSRLLSTLYRVVSSINQTNAEDMFTQVLKTINKELDIEMMVLRQWMPDGSMRRLASIGDLLPAENQRELAAESPLLENSDENGRFVVSLPYRDQIVGTCSFYLSRKQLDQSQSLEEVLNTIGRHLGIAIEKARVDKENMRLSIVEERSWLANELHDSLAQTVNSLRFQVRVLDQNLHEGNEAIVWQNLERVENALEEANQEVRNLVEQFKGGTSVSPKFTVVNQLIMQFRRENPDVKIFLENKYWTTTLLPKEYTLQISRIIQESLTNACNHGKANCIRVLLRSDDNDGNHLIVIEDNGVGISSKMIQDREYHEKHFGLDVMRERAESIGGSLEVDSEPGEGVRVTLRFQYQPRGED